MSPSRKEEIATSGQITRWAKSTEGLFPSERYVLGISLLLRWYIVFIAWFDFSGVVKLLILPTLSSRNFSTVIIDMESLLYDDTSVYVILIFITCRFLLHHGLSNPSEIMVRTSMIELKSCSFTRLT